MTINELAQEFIKDYEDDSTLFHKSRIKNLSEDDLELLEEILLQRIPNLIITHADRDIRTNIRIQVERIKEILDSGEVPYFIDFSCSKTFVKKK